MAQLNRPERKPDGYQELGSGYDGELPRVGESLSVCVHGHELRCGSGGWHGDIFSGVEKL